MAKYFYPEEFQEIPKSQKKQITLSGKAPSQMTIKFILGYGAALSVIKSARIGNMKILLN